MSLSTVTGNVLTALPSVAAKHLEGGSRTWPNRPTGDLREALQLNDGPTAIAISRKPQKKPPPRATRRDHRDRTVPDFQHYRTICDTSFGHSGQRRSVKDPDRTIAA